MKITRNRSGWSLVLTCTIVCGVALALSGCGSGKSAAFHYPGENIKFPAAGEKPPKLFVEFVEDHRPASQRNGEGGLSTYRFPSDENWDEPVSQIYYRALVQDLTETNLVVVVPLRSEADYVLEVSLNHLGCKVSRSGVGYAMTAIIGGAVGYAVSQSAAATVGGAIIGVGAIPVPTKMRAVCEVNLRVYDREQELFWDRTCLGEITKSKWEGITTRNDQQWVDDYLTVAVKRCNACLLGQLRQALVEEMLDEAAP